MNTVEEKETKTPGGNHWATVSLLLRVVPKFYSFVWRLQEPEGYKQ